MISRKDIHKLKDTPKTEHAVNLIRENEAMTEVALDVIKGKYGNGEERAHRLRKAGHDYFMVQSIVNRLIGCWEDTFGTIKEETRGRLK